MLSASAGSLDLERDGATGRYRVLSGGFALAEVGRSAVLAAPDVSASQLWGGCRAAATTTSSALRRGSPSTSRTPVPRRATPSACTSRTERAPSAGRSPRRPSAAYSVVFS